VIGHAGRFHDVKNQIGLVHAAGQLLRQGYQFRLVLAGANIDATNKALVQAIRDADVERQVILLGPVKPIASFLSICDLFVNASLGEAFPNIVAEAMAMAIPVLATNAGDTEMIIGKAGHLIESSSPESLAQGIGSMLRLSSSDLNTLGAAGRSRIAAHYSQKSSTSAYLNLYQSLRLQR
jgi:glycosyltransferase involved in cell wall biosynthesis